MTHRIVAIVGLLVLLAVACRGSVSSRDSVAAELTRLRGEEGLSLVTAIRNKLYEVDYPHRSLRPGTTFFAGSDPVDWGSLSSDGTEVAFRIKASKNSPTMKQEGCSSNGGCLALSRIDGTGLRLFGDIGSPFGMCWSHDSSRLVLLASNPKVSEGESTPALQVLNLETGDAEQIGDLNAVVTSQCWSADDSEIVYTLNQERGVRLVRLFDVRTRRSRDVTQGAFATWSSDGKFMAFLKCPPSLEDCDYYEIDPSNTRTNLLFHTDVGQTPIWWSPDSRFVAYVSPIGPHEDRSGATASQVYRLRVRRLADNAEDWVLNLAETDALEFQWTQTKLWQR
jgi:hypothetical protein